MNDIIQKIKEENICKIDEGVSLSKLTTYRVGGKASCIAYPKDINELVNLLKLLKSNGVKYKLLGNGSNLLFSDNDYQGVLIKLSEFNNIEFISKNKLRVGAGYSLIKLSLLTAKKGLTGLEFASGIPGSVGGAVFMNAGAYKSDMGYVVESVKVLTPNYEVINLENKEMNFHYRSSYLQKNRDYICLEVIIKLQVGKRDAIEEVIKERRERRIASQPLEYPSAGSVFRNPEGNFAGKLIEDCSLKGMKRGGAMISDKHANFVVNYKDATSSDIKYLIDLAHDTVLEKYGIDIFGEAIEMARENASLAGERINFIHRDYMDFKHDYKFDEIISNLPSRGKKTKEEMDSFYGEFFEKSKSVLAENAVMILYSNESGFIKKQLRLRPEYRLIQEFIIRKKTNDALYIIGYRS